MARLDINNEYFTGSQASIFIGDVWVDEIIDWQCSVGANATPIYGYGDTFFSHAAQGRVLVQGNFTINFKEPNYLFAILERYKRYLNLPEAKKQQFADDNPYKPADSIKELTYVDKRNAIDDFFARPPNTGEDLAQVAGNIISRNQNFMNTFGGSTLSTLDPRLVNDYAIPLFDIKIGYGTTFDEDTIGEQIIGVKLLGKGKTIMANGEPIKESYSFFAKNLV